MSQGSPDVSICMVSLNCWAVLEDCLDSLRASDPAVTHEIILVDNASTDETVARVESDYPEVKLVLNDKNVGFSRATNQGIELGTGRHILWLNTDTIVEPDSLRVLVEFLDNNPKAGIVGPRVNNPDGSFQPQCRRGMPTPLAALSYALKLDRIWPDRPALGQYLLTNLPVDEPTQVAAVSGCCLMARREVLADIGLIDEEIYQFGEDLDWCVQAGEAGWEVWYRPESVIVHLKGQGGAHARPYLKAWGIHQAMWVFYRKHMKQRYPWYVNLLMWTGIATKFALSVIAVWVRSLFGGRRKQAA